MSQPKVAFPFPLPVFLCFVLFFSYSIFHDTYHSVQIAWLFFVFLIERELHPDTQACLLMPVKARKYLLREF